jgi:type II secretory pathway pseudopilin PulG
MLEAITMSASLQNFLNPILVQILIAVLGVLGAVVTSWWSYRAAAEASEQKIREIELAYRHKLDENYLAHARSHIDTLYMPINHCLSTLAAQHYKLKARVASDKSAEVELRQACENYVKEIEGLLYYEKDVYLTPRLYESLHSFTEFIREVTLGLVDKGKS